MKKIISDRNDKDKDISLNKLGNNNNCESSGDFA